MEAFMPRSREQRARALKEIERGVLLHQRLVWESQLVDRGTASFGLRGLSSIPVDL